MEKRRASKGRRQQIGGLKQEYDPYSRALGKEERRPMSKNCNYDDDDDDDDDKVFLLTRYNGGGANGSTSSLSLHFPAERTNERTNERTVDV